MANLLVSKHSTAQRILFDGAKAVGLKVSVRGSVVNLKLNREVVVSAGAIASPQLLLSGVGDPKDLKKHGNPVVAQNNEVGKNMQDHPGLGMTYEVSIPTFNDEMALWKQAIHGANWLFRGKGVGTTPDAHLVGFIRTGDHTEIPDIQVHVTPAGYLVSGEGELVLKESSFSTVVSVCRPKSRGRVELRSAIPFDTPKISHRLFDDPQDLECLTQGVKKVRGIVDQAPISNLVKRPIEPPWTHLDDAEIKSYLRANAGTIYHPSCTCRMGTDLQSVVTPDLKVRGVEGVRVADASIIPNVTSGNLNAPCMMIGEMAAAKILEQENERE